MHTLLYGVCKATLVQASMRMGTNFGRLNLVLFLVASKKGIQKRKTQKLKERELRN